MYSRPGSARRFRGPVAPMRLTIWLPYLLFLATVVTAMPHAVAQPLPAELLRNGTFEGGSGADGRGGGVPRWNPVDNGYDVDRRTRHGGDQAIRCDNLRPNGRRGAACR